MIIECPMCGAWSGPAHGDAAKVISQTCDECTEIESCEECAMDEKEAFCQPFDPVCEAEDAPDFDAEDEE